MIKELGVGFSWEYLKMRERETVKGLYLDDRTEGYIHNEKICNEIYNIN